MAEAPLFRPVKRRKFMRKRPDEKSAKTEPTPIDTVASPSFGAEDIEPPQSPTNDKGLSVAEILRLRKLRKTRKGGIEFSNAPAPSHPDDANSNTLVIQDADADTGRVREMSDRFTPHTGQVVDANKHMYVLSTPQAQSTCSRD